MGTESGGRDVPVFLLGASGFAPGERAIIARALASLPAGWSRWQLAPLAEADAWWVNGTRTDARPDGSLTVAAAAPSEATLQLQLTAVDRPIAFSLPLAARDFEPRCVFSLDDEAGMHSALHMFGTWLQPVHALFVLGALVMRRGNALRHTVHHLNHRGKLLAVLDYREGHVAVLPTATPDELWHAEWDRRPAAAHDLPRNFIEYAPAQLVWAYVRRTAADLLPVRYRSDTIYYRHAPRVPPRWLRDSQLVVLRELHAEPATFEELRQRTGLAAATLAHDLSCFYYAGAVTTTASKAAPPGHPLPASSQPSHPVGQDSDLPAQRPHELTAPVMLNPLTGEVPRLD